MTHSTNLYRHWLPNLAALCLLLLCSFCGGNNLGQPCSRHQDCKSDLQCLNEICVPKCQGTEDCGDGFLCADGTCEEVHSLIGDPCDHEQVCGRGQSCFLDRKSPVEGEYLSGTCQTEVPGDNVGSPCSTSEQCRTGLCALGVCGQLCQEAAHCPNQTACVEIPEIVAGVRTRFRSCLQKSGVISTKFHMLAPEDTLQIPVPSSAVSFVLVAQVDDNLHEVGATRVLSPTGKLLYRTADTIEELLDNPIRHLPRRGLSTLFVPNSDKLALETGVYTVSLAATLPPFSKGTKIPEVTVFYKLDTSRLLDLHFYFLDLTDHPCKETFGISELTAETAPGSRVFQVSYLDEIRRIFAQADIEIRNVYYKDIHRADLDGLRQEDEEELFALADNPSGVAIFLVRSLSSDGLQTLWGPSPGPPRSPGTVASGVAVSMNTLCYRPWDSLARVTAHSVAGYMGLWNNRDAQGIVDPLSDTTDTTENLMYFGEFGDSMLTEGQAKVLSRYSGLE